MAQPKSTVKLSLPATQTVRGYEIRRMHLGAMLDALEALQNLPGDLLKVCFPGMDAGQALNQMKKLDADMLSGMLVNAFTAAPRYISRVLAQLLGIPEQQLLDDPAIGLDGLPELVNAWLEINGIENFFRAVRPLAARIRAALGASSPQQKTGSNALSPTPRP